MKKIVFILIAVMALAGCSQASRLQMPPMQKDLPDGFEYVQPAGNGYFLYQSPIGRFLVSSQRQGSALGGFFESNIFIDIVYIGE
jgi:predicted small lipoprotein YifL